MDNLKDIETEKDIQVLVDNFYKKVNEDPMLGPIFNDVAHVNWEKHMPVMYSFWSSILLGSMTYSGLPFPKHTSLPIGTAHFEKWLHYFKETVDEHFKGRTADEAKERALRIANTFQYKLGLLK